MNTSTMIKSGSFVFITDCGFADFEFLDLYASKVKQIGITKAELLPFKDDMENVDLDFESISEMLENAGDPEQGHLHIYDVSALTERELGHFLGCAEYADDECGYSVNLIEGGLTVLEIAKFLHM